MFNSKEHNLRGKVIYRMRIMAIVGTQKIEKLTSSIAIPKCPNPVPMSYVSIP
jgi:hypothetical protein